MPRKKIPKLNNDQLEILKETIKRCREDFFYFINFTSLYMHDRHAFVKFSELIYDKQKELIKLFLEKKYLIILKSRQIGISTLTQIFCAWLLLFYPNFQIGIVSRKGSEATNFSKRVREIIDSVPPVLTLDNSPDDRYVKKTEQSFQLKNGSACIAEAVSLSEPNKVFRGRTLHLIIFDEAAFITKVQDVFTSVAPAAFKAHKELENSNIPYGIFLISTPNGVTGKGKWFWEQWTKALKGESKFYPVEIHYSQVPFATPKWVEELKKIMNDEFQWEQEMELKFIAPQESLLGDLVRTIKNTTEEPKEVEFFTFDYGEDHFTVQYKKWFEEQDLDQFIRIIIGVDVASIIGDKEKHSSSSIEILAIRNDRSIVQIGEVIEKIPITELKNIIIKIWKSFYDRYKNVLIVVENNSYAQSLCESLAYNSELPYDSLYWEENKKIPGVTTTAKTKPVILESIYWFLREYKNAIKSKVLFNDLLGLQKIKETPDSVMALGMATYIIRKQRDSIFRLQPAVELSKPDNELAGSNLFFPKDQFSNETANILLDILDPYKS